MELCPGGAQAVLQGPGAPLDGGAAMSFLGQALVLDAEDDLARDDGGRLHIHVVVPVGAVLPKEERPTDLFTEVQRNPQAALEAGGEHGAIAGPARIEFLRSLLEEHRSARHQRRGVRELAGGDALHTGYRRFADRSEQLVLLAAGLEEDHAHRVEVEGGADSLTHGREDLSQVQAGGEGAGDALQSTDEMLSPPLPVEQGDRFDEGADQAADGATPLDMDGAVRVRDATHRAQLADDAAPDE
jgi:hypothetical protein